MNENNTITVNMENLSEEDREKLIKLIEKSQKQPKKQWEPEAGEKYYFVNEAGIINEEYYFNCDYSKGTYNLLNCFKTKEEAEFALEKKKVIAELERFALENNAEDFDVSDSDCEKYGIMYRLESKKIDIGYSLSVITTDIHFSSKEITEKAIQQVGEDRIKKYLFNVTD